jgi:hypothetical protein
MPAVIISWWLCRHDLWRSRVEVRMGVIVFPYWSDSYWFGVWWLTRSVVPLLRETLWPWSYGKLRNDIYCIYITDRLHCPVSPFKSVMLYSHPNHRVTCHYLTNDMLQKIFCSVIITPVVLDMSLLDFWSSIPNMVTIMSLVQKQPYLSGTVCSLVEYTSSSFLRFLLHYQPKKNSAVTGCLDTTCYTDF